MKNVYFVLILLVMTGFQTFAGGLRAYFSYAKFNVPGGKPYIETYLSVDGSSVKYATDDNKNWYGKLNIKVVFSKNDTIVNFNKYQLSSPVLTDTSLPPLNFLDVQRYTLSEGTYSMKLTIKDVNSDKPPFESVTEITVGFNPNKITFSDIELVGDYRQSNEKSIFTKMGYSIFPYVFNYYPESVKKLTFYGEVYGADKVFADSTYILNYYIRPYEIDKKLDSYFRAKRVNPKEVTPILSSFSISKLPTGNYLLVLEARDRNNRVRASNQIFFQRYNPGVEFNLTTLLAYNAENTFVGRISNKDTLIKYIKYTFPISTDFERRYAESQIANPDVSILQKYFLNFWITRDKSNPEQAWIDYKHLVDYANKKFKTIALDGYETDRGRVFLKYGQPDNVTESYNEPAAYPYEIWQYYELKGQHNKKFVFYTRDIVTNDFQLIHSDAVGELRNNQWQYIVYKRVMYPGNVVDPISQPNSWGNKSTDYYLQPR